MIHEKRSSFKRLGTQCRSAAFPVVRETSIPSTDWSQSLSFLLGSPLSLSQSLLYIGGRNSSLSTNCRHGTQIWPSSPSCVFCWNSWKRDLSFCEGDWLGRKERVNRRATGSSAISWEPVAYEINQHEGNGGRVLITSFEACPHRLAGFKKQFGLNSHPL